MNALALATRGYICECTSPNLASSIAPTIAGKSHIPAAVAQAAIPPTTLIQVDPDLKPITKPGRRKK